MKVVVVGLDRGKGNDSFKHVFLAVDVVKCCRDCADY
jgi:hypothetical protein